MQQQAYDTKTAYAVPVPQGMNRDPRVEMRGLAPGGVYETEKYVGTKTWIGAGVCCAFTCCGCWLLLCPFDQRETYTEPGPNGRKVVLDNGSLN